MNVYVVIIKCSFKCVPVWRQWCVVTGNIGILIDGNIQRVERFFYVGNCGLCKIKGQMHFVFAQEIKNFIDDDFVFVKKQTVNLFHEKLSNSLGDFGAIHIQTQNIQCFFSCLKQSFEINIDINIIASVYHKHPKTKRKDKYTLIDCCIQYHFDHFGRQLKNWKHRDIFFFLYI